MAGTGALAKRLRSQGVRAATPAHGTLLDQYLSGGHDFIRLPDRYFTNMRLSQLQGGRVYYAY